MENLDAIVVVIGVALIIAGMALFITGKVVSQNNQIEAFGVKINFNNPSFMLVVAGIGMVLVPRLLPDPHRIAQLPPTAAGISTESHVSSVAETPIGVEAQTRTDSNDPQQPIVQNRSSSSSSSPGEAIGSALPMAGTYELLSYTINNIPQVVEGSMFVEPRGRNQYQWRTQFYTYDYLGNYMNFVYSGALDFNENNWFLDVNASNDPTWFDAGSVATEVKQEGDFMGMSYVYNGNFISAMWEKTSGD